MKRNLGGKHLQSSAHQIQVHACAQQARDHQAAQVQFQQTYHGLSIPPNQTFPSTTSAPRPSFFTDVSEDQESDGKLCGSYTWDNTVPILHEHPTNLSSEEQQEILQQQFKAIIAHA